MDTINKANEAKDEMIIALCNYVLEIFQKENATDMEITKALAVAAVVKELN